MAAPTAPRYITPSIYSTAGIGASEQFDYWRDISGIEVTRLSRDDRGKSFNACGAVYNLGRLVIDRFQSDGKYFERASRHISQSSPDHITLHLVHAGAVTLASGDRETTIQPGEITFSDLSKPSRGRTGIVDRSVIFLPRDLIPQFSLHADGLFLSKPRGGLVTILHAYLIKLIETLPCLTEAECKIAVDATCHVLTACIAPDRDILERSKAALATLYIERARQYIDSNLHRRIQPAELCRYLNLSRASLYRLFAPYSGIAEYGRHRRLRASHARLAEADEQGLIKQIWIDYGFKSAADFSRAFRRQFGYSPSDVPPRATATRPCGRADPDEGKEHDQLRQWLHTLRN